MLLKLCLWLSLICIYKTVVSDSIKEKDGRLTINIHRQKTPFEQHLNAPNLKKYGLNSDWFYKKHSIKGDPRTNDSVSLKRYLDNEFYGEIVIGHPGQTLYVAFDTSWTLSWVMSSQCQVWYHIGCLFHNRYDHTKSSEYKPDGRKIVVPEGKYNISGFFSYDNISIAHSNVTNFSFAEMTDIPKTFLYSKIDGVLGLGLQYDAYVPFFYTLLKQNKIKNPIFSVYLNRDKQSNNGGNIILGFIEQRHIHSHKDKDNHTIYDAIKYMPVKSSQFWQFDLESIIVDNKAKEGPLSFCGNGKCQAITDTSSNNIIGPKADVDQIHILIKARPFYMDRFTVNCDTVNKLPVIAFTVGGQNFTLKGRDYTVKMSHLSVTVCLSAFVTHDYNDFWVLGGAFLAEYYTIYDIDKKQIGIVKSA